MAKYLYNELANLRHAHLLNFLQSLDHPNGNFDGPTLTIFRPHENPYTNQIFLFRCKDIPYHLPKNFR